MITTVYYTHKNFPVPSNRILEKILNLNEPLNGQSIKLKSIFNPADTDPSMVIFYSEVERIYRFKDFSSGNYGDAIDIVMHLFNMSDRQTAYNKVLDIFKNESFDEMQKFIYEKENKEIDKYALRKWNNRDAKYWKEHSISINLLTEYNVKPIETFYFKITKGDTTKQLKFEPLQCYGFFTKEDVLYKIYQPKNKSAKFIKVKENVQGLEQLKYKSKCLIIASSLKDIMAFRSLMIPNIELIAPDSENVTITTDLITQLKSKYEFVFTMFDNDQAGIKAMLKYKELYNIPYINFNIEKDIAECVKQHGLSNSKNMFIKIFKNVLKKLKENPTTI